MARTVKKEDEGSYDDEIKSLLQDQPEDACTLQVIGFSDYVQPEVFQEQFNIFALQKGIPAPTVVSVYIEDKYPSFAEMRRVDDSCSKEMFIEFKSEAAAGYVLWLPKFSMNAPGQGSRFVEFRKPLQNNATRVAARKYRELQKRDYEIQNEYKAIGAVRSHTSAKPELPSHFQNKAFFMELLPALERKRKAGQEFSMHELCYLKTHQLKDTDKLKARINALYKEECYMWLKMRKYELAGLKI